MNLTESLLKCVPSTATEIRPPLVISSADELAWDDSCDIVVVGYGLAGAAAALEAADAGDVDVILADRFRGGGTSALSGGVIYAGGGTQAQQAEGVEDRPEWMAEYLEKESDGVVSSPETIRKFAYQSAPTVDWLTSKGVRFSGPVAKKKTSYPPPSEFLYFSGNEQVPAFATSGSPAPRGHRARDPNNPQAFSGKALMDALSRTICATQPIRLQLQSAARRLVVDRQGHVVGVELWQLSPTSWAGRCHSWLYDQSKSVMLSITGLSRPFWRGLAWIERRYARPMLVRARGGVVLATGGFAFNAQMVNEMAPIYARTARAGSIGDDGSGVRLGASIGAATGQMHLLSAWRFVSPPLSWVKGIIVNGAGQRIVNEEQYGARIGQAILERGGGTAWLVVDDKTQAAALAELRHEPLWAFQRLPGLMRARMAKRAGTITRLEQKIGLPPGALTATVQEYNAAISQSRGDRMGKSAGMRAEISRPPFHAMDISVHCKLDPLAAITLGGLAVAETTGAALDQQGKPILGLYAAGRAAVGICSANYVSGTSLADCVWSGRRAAKSIVEGLRCVLR